MICALFVKIVHTRTEVRKEAESKPYRSKPLPKPKPLRSRSRTCEALPVKVGLIIFQAFQFCFGM